ncbi:hypothetical protein TSTA_083910 [Talaromyces stipitatus ATCC 10500]|uniref:Uncharacterized protein n=1 Tax=Talaromyces stipitatus (strain ATCC 10500 / CBS 375.48 / QM 6759 / NRRL 1006) TaxID=441959 RepID=B8M062_TALSN|nr:uncharacterized protein TSTA_083910 [Talaromyces stipitatus ATCC 10500]EED21159.1 hypothetical protein TSTA_083910 [Talaromyces stipitatus ATCC 10500]
MAPIRHPLQDIQGNNQALAKKSCSKDAACEEDESELFEIDHPFIIPIEMYLSVQSYPYDIKTTFYITTFFEPSLPAILELIQSSLGDPTALDAYFDWAYVGGIEVMPTVFIDVPPGTVTDWADLESRIRELLARGASKLGIVVNVQFQLKDVEDII